MVKRQVAIDLKGYSDKKRTVKGYASVFGNLDSDLDTLQKGAFIRTLESNGPDGKGRIKLVSQHNIGKPVGKINVLKEDDKGLYMEATFGTHSDGEDHYKMVKEGILTEFSIGFVPLEEEKNEYGGRDFSQVKLYEVSLVTVAANDEAKVMEVKSDKNDTDLLDSMLSLVKSLKDEDAAFKLERDIYTLKSLEVSKETTTPLESDLAVKEDSLDSVVEEKKDDFDKMLEYL